MLFMEKKVKKANSKSLLALITAAVVAIWNLVAYLISSNIF